MVNRWSISTMRQQRRSRCVCWMPCVRNTSTSMPTCIVACITSRNRLPTSMRLPVRRCASLSMPRRQKRLSSPVAPQKPSISWRLPSARVRCRKVTRCLFLIWSTTPISCLGSCRPRSEALWSSTCPSLTMVVW